MYYGVCYSLVEPIKFDLWDFNNVKKDRTLGKVEFMLKELLHHIDPKKDGTEGDDAVVPNTAAGAGASASANVEGGAGEKTKEELEEVPKSPMVDVDLVREAWLSKNKLDGWKVEVMGNLVDV
jgi:hypothetical protein